MTIDFADAFHKAMSTELNLPLNIFKFAVAERVDDQRAAEAAKASVTDVMAALEGMIADNQDGYVYFIEGGGLVKVGYSTNPRTRLHNLGTMSPVPLQILAAFPGSYRAEGFLHRRLARLRHHGEWFTVNESLLRLMLEIVRRYGTWDEQEREETDRLVSLLGL